MTVPFTWTLPYAWPRIPVLAQNVVCTSQPLAAQAGLAMLAGGGSAVDAALATAITLSLIEPVSNGIGSDAFAIVWDGHQLHGLNASGRSPAAWTPEYFTGDRIPALGWNAVTVPGAVSAWVELHNRFGKLSFARIFEPAVGYGRNGFLVSPTIAGQWAEQAPIFDRNQASPGRSCRAAGRRRRGSASIFPTMRTRLRKSRDQGRIVLPGRAAARIEAHSMANGGAMLSSDLAAHRADWVDTIATDYRGYTLQRSRRTVRASPR